MTQPNEKSHAPAGERAIQETAILTVGFDRKPGIAGELSLSHRAGKRVYVLSRWQQGGSAFATVATMPEARLLFCRIIQRPWRMAGKHGGITNLCLHKARFAAMRAGRRAGPEIMHEENEALLAFLVAAGWKVKPGASRRLLVSACQFCGRSRAGAYQPGADPASDTAASSRPFGRSRRYTESIERQDAGIRQPRAKFEAFLREA